MAFESPRERTGGDDGSSLASRTDGKDAPMPMQIAHNPLLTAREKLDLLHRLKAEVMGALENSEDLGLSPRDIEEAIQEVRVDVENGVGEETVLRGDN